MTGSLYWQRIIGNSTFSRHSANFLKLSRIIIICFNNAQVTVSGNGVADVIGHGNEVTVMDGTVNVYGEEATFWVRGGVADVHGMHSKVVVFNGKATVMDRECQELHCND